MPSRRKLIGRKLERRVVGQATLLALLQPAAEAGCVALEFCVLADPTELPSIAPESAVLIATSTAHS